MSTGTIASGSFSSPPPAPCYTIVDVAGKGQGLVASRDLVRGTELVAERPTLLIDLELAVKQETAYAFLSSLSPPDLITLLSVPTDHPELKNHPVLARLNKFTLLDPRDDRFVVYLPELGKVNHACSPNALLCWEHDPENQRPPVARLLAITSIPAGGEITVSYLVEPMTFEDRQKSLRWNPMCRFACACSTCTLSLPDRRLHDIKIDRLRDVLKQIAQNKSLPPPVSLVRQLASLAMMAAEDRACTSMLGVILSLATQACISGADEASARAWAELFVEWNRWTRDWSMLKNAIQCLQPRQHPVWGRQLHRTGVKREPLQPPPSVVRRFFETLKLAPGYRPLLQPALASHPSQSSSTSNLDGSDSNANADEGPLTAATLAPAIELGATADGPMPSSVPPDLRPQQPSKSQKKRAKAKQARKSSLSASYVPTPSPPIGPSSPSLAADDATPRSHPTNIPLPAPTSPLASTSSARISPDELKTPPTTQGQWRRLTPKEKKKEQDRIKNAHASPVQPKAGSVSPVAVAAAEKVVESPTLPAQPETEEEKPAMSNKAKKRMLAAAEADEARRRAAQEAEEARNARPPSPEPKDVPLPSSPEASEEEGEKRSPLSASQKKRMKKRVARERQRTVTGTTGSGESGEVAEEEEKEGDGTVAVEKGEGVGEGEKGGMTSAQRKKLKERERRKAMKDAQAQAGGARDGTEVAREMDEGSGDVERAEKEGGEVQGVQA